jgi:hypothetical protein
MAAVVEPGSVSAVMFNLGYLPRGDHAIITQSDSTVPAIAAAVKALRDGGVMTVLCYRGHAGGPEEYAAVERLLSGYAGTCHLRKIESTPKGSASPVLFVLIKDL